MPELFQTFEAMQKSEEEKRIFFASLQGKTLERSEDSKGPTFDDIRRRAMGINARGDDIVSLQGSFAQEEGFGVGMGLGYSRE